jgi:hypothetical protein
MRAEEAAAHSWREARLDRTAAAAKMSAVELPFVEAAPLMSIAFANGTEDIPGVALAFLCLDHANVLEASAALRDLWAHNLTPGLMEGYDPIVLSEETMLRVVANATINGDHCMPMAPGERQAAQRIEHEDMGLVVCQMDSATLDAVRVAARAAAAGSASAVEVAVMRDGLTRSAVSHLLAVRGGVLDGPAQEVARCSEAGAFKMKPDKPDKTHFAGLGQQQGCSTRRRSQSASPSTLTCERGPVALGQSTWGSLHPLTQVGGASRWRCGISLTKMGVRASARGRGVVGPPTQLQWSAIAPISHAMSASTRQCVGSSSMQPHSNSSAPMKRICST